jgi:hypothetical protein
MKPVASFMEDPRLAEVDNAADLISLKLRTMSRAASKDKARYRQELRQLLQTYVDAAMRMADAISH